RAWIEVDNGRITGAGYSGGGHIGATTLRFAGRSLTLAAVALPALRQDPVVGGDAARFVQTTGGRTGAAMPRRVSHPPFVQVSAPIAWTTLALTIQSDGRSTHEVVGASPFPRHWIYDPHGDLAHKTGTTDFRRWAKNAFGGHTPWGEEDSTALVTEVETALERELSTHIMRSGRIPRVRTVVAGTTVFRQGEEGRDIVLVLDGVLSVVVDERELTHLGPGAVLGERAVLEGRRTATLIAVTGCRLAAIDGADLDPALLQQLSQGHRREASATVGSAPLAP
ncbi:MAG TPA: cyclic nucleotide-binding domain-containing protein, partial [Dehalococcoidia bacterium]|nr:cyclic nucleotide-binding domain-containing protein [Dehalococcoidia bacterium]